MLVSTEAVTLGFQRYPGDFVARGVYALARYKIFTGLLLASVVCITAGVALQSGSLAIAIVGWGTGLAALRFTSGAWLMWRMPWRYAGILIPSVLVRTIALLAFVYAGMEPELALGLAGFAGAFVAVSAAPRVRGIASLSTLPWSWRFAVSLALASAGVTVLQGVDRVVVSHVSTGNSAGSYAAMASLAAMSLGVLHGLININYYPELIQASRAQDIVTTVAVFNRAVSRVQIVSGIALVGVALTGVTVVPLFYGPGYLDMPILVCLLVASALFGLGHQYSWFFHLSADAQALRNRSLSAAAVGALACIVGGSIADVTGLAIGSLVGSTVYALLLGSPIRRIALRRSGAILLLAAGGLAALIPLDAVAIPVAISAGGLMFFARGVLTGRPSELGILARAESGGTQ